LRLSLSLMFATVALVVTVGLIVVVAYCAFTERWLQAIFFLLARKELLSWLDQASDRIEERETESKYPTTGEGSGVSLK
jgi:hypothetical protein